LSLPNRSVVDKAAQAASQWSLFTIFIAKRFAMRPFSLLPSRIGKGVLHLLFWLAVWVFYVYFFSYNSTDQNYIFWFSGALLPVAMGVSYLMVYRLIPRYLLTRQYLRFLLYSFYALVFSAYMVVLIIYASLIVILKSEVRSMPPMTKNFASILILVYLVVGLVSLLKLLNHNFQTLSRNKALQHKILSTQLQLKDQELNYLKMQIHPHFLFNTLNTLYGLALKKSAHTPDVILKLSNLLDYILYQVSKPRVALHDEVEHIKAYIELERIRFQENLKVDFVAPAIPADLSVAPMLLIPFVENAFKHGNLMDGFLTIEVRITLAADRFDFHIRNTSFHEGAHPEREGIGLENMQKRLLLHYPHAHQLHVARNGQWFEVSLTLFQLNAPTYESSGTMSDS